MNNDEDGYALAKPPRRTGPGCPRCGAEVEPTKGQRWPQHSPPGAPKTTKCDLSGLGTYYPTDDYFRTFCTRDTPDGFPDEGHRITTLLQNHGDAIGFANTLQIPTSHAFDTLGAVGAHVITLITKADYPRLRDELDRMAERLGWNDTEGNDTHGS